MIPLAKNIKRYFSLKEFAILMITLVFSISAGIGVFFGLKKEVVIIDNGKQIIAKTMKSTVKEVLDQNGVRLKPEDYISTSLDYKLQRLVKNEIYIKRALPVNVTADGQEITLMTYRDTVKDALLYGGIQLFELDRLEGAELQDPIVKDMAVSVIRVKEETVTENNPIPFNTVSRENSRLDKGVEKVIREGSEGIFEKVFKVVLENGRQVAKDIISEGVALAPVDKIVELGTVLNHKTARGDTLRYKKVLDMRATAYTASFQDTGKSPDNPMFGITASGARARKGIIAVDPRVIPLGTRLYVEVAGNTPDYGFAIAGDTGGAIKGDLIDLFYDEQDFVNRWGVKRVKVYFLVD